MVSAAVTLGLVIETFWGPRPACQAAALLSLAGREYVVEQIDGDTVYTTPVEKGDEDNGTHVQVTCGRWSGMARYVTVREGS